MVSRKRMIMGAAGLVVVAALVALALHQWKGDDSSATRTTVRGSGAPQTRQQQIDPDEASPPTHLQSDQVAQLVGEARRFAKDGKFDEAEASLAKAEKVVKGAPQIAEARDEFAMLKTPEGRLAAELVRARLAVEHGDRAVAEKSLAEIEKLKPDAPELAELKQTLEREQAHSDRRDNRIKEHLVAMREAIARGDFAAADGELNAAARVDVSDPTVQQARVELARAHDEARKKDALR